ncbi:MAG: lytic transglycosylase domain-containing protein [Bacteroidaceae bacterium]|nr:lytic transglycosylase domain-containing protein [Bacteroidaceae bacterium]
MRKLICMACAIMMFSATCLVTDAGDTDTYLTEEIQSYCVEIGDEYGACPELLMAIIESESSGKPTAKNGSCKGLMQVSEKWHKDRMARLGVTDIYDPYGNILVGTDYLMELADKHEDIGMVLMVYNGDSNAKKYLNGEADLSKYARKILERSAELERKHGK